METKYLLIGNSAGGIGAAEAIREVDKKGTLTVVSEEAYPAYSRPLISKYLAGETTLEEMLFRRADFYEKNDILLLSSKKVTGLELEHRVAQLDDGEEIFWQKLLLAVGGKPIFPNIKGSDKRGVFTFTDLDDAKAVATFLSGIQRAIVIGGGLIGVSVTEALVKRRVHVTVVEMKDRILNTILDPEASLMVEKIMTQAGVRIITGHTTVELCGADNVEEAILDDGEAIPCDLVLVAIGISPRLELARNARLEVNRGIVVDKHMATNYPDVYACGDVAEVYDFVYEENRVTPVWPNAYVGGRIAGYNMAGFPTEYPGGTAINSLSYFGIDITSAGMSVAPGDDGYEVLCTKRDDTYQKLILKHNRIVGMILAGIIEKSGIILSLMRDKVNVENFKQSLLADNFGLAFLPRALWEERLEISPGLIVQSAPLHETEKESFAGE